MIRKIAAPPLRTEIQDDAKLLEEIKKSQLYLQAARVIVENRIAARRRGFDRLMAKISLHCPSCKKQFATEYEAGFCCAERQAEKTAVENLRDPYANQFDQMA